MLLLNSLWSPAEPCIKASHHIIIIIIIIIYLGSFPYGDRYHQRRKASGFKLQKALPPSNLPLGGLTTLNINQRPENLIDGLMVYEVLVIAQALERSIKCSSRLLGESHSCLSTLFSRFYAFFSTIALIYILLNIPKYLE